MPFTFNYLYLEQHPISLKLDPKCCSINFTVHHVEGRRRLTFILMNIHAHGIPHSAKEIARNI